MKLVSAVVGAISLVACNSARRVAVPSPLYAPVRLARCEGPATSLPDSLARTLPRRRGSLLPDTRWADLATVVPGGFAGTFYDSTRWNFAQLVDWFDYIFPRLGVPAAADKDEALNRIRFSVTSIELRDRVIAALDRLSLPCDLVVVDLNGGIVEF